MTAVPNELKITINTSIPGFQTIRYKPFMTLPDDKNDNAVQFNPLVKLKPSIIKSLPENIQKREFFNKGLFQSLLNSHGLIREKSLLQATSNGIVDNNIKVTLDTLFPVNSVLYINKQPYVIADVQWTNGDWKIDKKIQQLPELESSRITDPYLYRTIVKDEIISGENELEKLPKEIIYGSNYTGPQNVASGITPVPPAPVPPAPPAPVPPVPPAKPFVINKQQGPRIDYEGQYYDAGDQQYHSFKVTVYITKPKGDIYVGGGSVSRGETVKAVLDSFKQKCNTCIISSGKQYVKSLEGKDLYTSFAHLNLKYDTAEIFIVS